MICKCGHEKKYHGQGSSRVIDLKTGLLLESKWYGPFCDPRYNCSCTKYELDNLSIIELKAKRLNLI